jgi:sugar lactone lactonase YvrE
MGASLSAELQLVVSGVAFPECLRWHQSELWFSDVLGGKVFRFDPKGELLRKIADIPPMAGGLGWSAKDEFLAVDIENRKVLRIQEDGNTSEYLELSQQWEFPANDMLIDDDGTMWVGSYGFNPETDEPAPSALARFKDGKLDFPIGGLIFPNGIAQIDSHHLVVAETFADRLAILEISASGTVTIQKRIQLAQGATPDGLCVDSGGQIWVASAYGEAVLKVDPASGKVERAIEIPGRGVFDCTFGGEKMTTLFIATSDVDESRALIDLPGKIFSIEI